LIGETVTVTNVTETAVEITLTLNWQIARAAADQFAAELPTSVASIMTFTVPGQRRVTRDDLGNGRTRVTFQLQQPVTDRLFVIGTASLPLPSNRVIRADVPSIVIPQGAPSTLSGQAHFWVLVNQSNGLLQPSAEQPEDKVTADQITTVLPPDLIQPAVAVVKLRPETAVWNLVYPEQFQVAPAVVTLATHITVISDDGSWRSRHQLQVTNESRQFLPVRLPKDSRLMYCLVQGRPSRVVTRGDGDNLRHLIPIPQSGALAAGFEVEFALAGRFDASAATIRKEWSSRRLSIPVPTFPEFRDDPELGISVSRNRWSVYVPASWRATLVDDPAVTNVVKAESEALEDASLRSEVEQAAGLLKSAKSAKGNYLKGRAVQQLQWAEESLRRYSGNDAGVEQQRGDVLSKLSELTAGQGGGQGGNAMAFGNGFLFEQESIRNYDNKSTFDSICVLNCPKDESGAQPGLLGGIANSPLTLGDGSVRFRLTMPDVERVLNEELRDKTDPAPSEGKRETVDELSLEKNAAKDDGAEDRRAGRSKLMQRRGEQAEAGKKMMVLEAQVQQMRQDLGIAAFELQPQAAAPADQTFDDVFEAAVIPTGLLSLKFDIPTDGERIDFLRVGGNPTLSLDVRSSKSVAQGSGLIWAVLCGVGILLLLAPGRKGRALEFCQRLFLIVTVAGFAAWLLTTGDLKAAGLLFCILGAIGLAITIATTQLRRPVV